MNKKDEFRNFYALIWCLFVGFLALLINLKALKNPAFKENWGFLAKNLGEIKNPAEE